MRRAGRLFQIIILLSGGKIRTTGVGYRLRPGYHVPSLMVFAAIGLRSRQFMNNAG